MIDATPQEPTQQTDPCGCQTTHRYVCGPIPRQQIRDCKPLRPSVSDYLKAMHISKQPSQSRLLKYQQELNGLLSDIDSAGHLMTREERQNFHPDALYISASVSHLKYKSNQYSLQHGRVFVCDPITDLMTDITAYYRA